MTVMYGHATGWKRWLRRIVVGLLVMLASTIPAAAQELERLDPNLAHASENTGPVGSIDGDLIAPEIRPSPASAPNAAFEAQFGDYSQAPAEPAAQEQASAPAAATTASTATTYGEDDLIGAAESVFGKGAEGLARLIEDLLAKQGRPTAYIVGREAGGALVAGLRYGSGTLHHKVEGTRPVYWTGPSVGFDAGANAAKTFVLVYNLYDTEDLFKRFLAGEGQAYFVGGLHVSYLRWGDIVLIPIRMGAGLRLGVNAGYMKFSKRQRWLPF